jgi:hypothetical protein
MLGTVSLQAYSKDGLAAAANNDPETRAKMEVRSARKFDYLLGRATATWSAENNLDWWPKIRLEEEGDGAVCHDVSRTFELLWP